MRKTVKIILRNLLWLILFAGAALTLFIYKIKNSFPVTYETEKPVINFPPDRPAILVFSKTTGYRHGETIEASLPVFKRIASVNHWFVYETEKGGVFNPGQLNHFKVVIFNNSSGRVLNDEQQIALSKYVEAGGAIIGIHSSGDDSHHWPWYETSLMGALFSHHPLNPQLQKTDVQIEANADSILAHKISPAWTNEDEWYVFFNQPKDMKILLYIDGDKILPSGNIFLVSDKNFGMGKHHPVAWYRTVKKGKSFYTSMGHKKEVWQDKNYIQMVENAMKWSMQ